MFFPLPFAAMLFLWGRIGMLSVFLSTDTGKTWTTQYNDLTNSYISCLAVSGENVFAGTSLDGIFGRRIMAQIGHQKTMD